MSYEKAKEESKENPDGHPNMFNDVDTVTELLGQLAGYSSSCWDNVGQAGTFMSTEAANGVRQAMERLAEILIKDGYQKLGSNGNVIFDAQAALIKAGVSPSQAFSAINNMLNSGLLIRRRA